MEKLSSLQKVAALTLALIAFCLLSGLLLYNQRYEREHNFRLQQLEQREDALIESLSREAAQMQQFLLLLKLRLLESSALTGERALQRSRVEEVFIDALQGREQSLVSQVRWLDSSGMERMRVNRNRVDGQWRIAAAEQLQDKSDRYYFRALRRLGVNQVFVSPLDLNTEEGVVVRPLQPTLRLAMPTRTQEGLHDGALVVNFNLASLLDRLYAETPEQLLLQVVDGDGHWLFNSIHPDWVWRQLNPAKTLLTTAPEYYARLQALLLSDGPRAPREGEEQGRLRRLELFPGLAGSEPWAVLSALTPELRDAMALSALRQTLPALLALLLLTAVLVLYFCRTEAREARLRRELLRKMQESDRAARFKSTFLANMGHEIRTPLTSIMGVLDLLRQVDLSDETRHYLQRVRKSARMLLQIVGDILDLSKLEGGNLQLQPQPFSLIDLLEDSLGLFSSSVAHKGIQLHLQLGEGLHEYLYADAPRLAQVLNNLLEGAINHTQRGRVQLAVEVSSERDYAMTLRFTVTDSGEGLTEEDLVRLSRPYDDAVPGTERSQAGSGLGLTICHLLLRQMGSHLQIESRPGEGSRFSFELTLEKRQRNYPGLLELRPAQQGSVLVIDPDPDLHQALGSLFQYWQVPATMVAGSVEALEWLDLNRAASLCRLVLVDRSVLRDRGLALFDELNKRAAAAGQPLQVAVMADESELADFQSDASRRRGLLTLAKPVMPSAVARLLGFPRPEVELDQREPEEAPFWLRAQNTKVAYNVLLVEDNHTNQLVISELLQRFGLEVETADNGAEALVLLHRRAFDLVFMDIQMPVMDGLQATREIRRHFSSAELPVVALSAAIQAEDVRAAEGVGMNAHMSKPVEVARLREVLLRFLPEATRVSSDPRGRGTVVSLRPELSERRSMAHFRGDPDFNLSQSIAESVGESVYLRAVEAFRAEMEPLLVSWKVEPDSWTQPRKAALAHQLKGAAGGIGAVALEHEALAADAAFKAGQDYDFQVLMGHLERVITKISNVPDLALAR